ncbi:hypothetical protein AB6806_23810 [Bosea sp. RCC_152_1]|uniref:hypothetical protein n=1 Tax=Bosea sp. RCC_152_1 TaxID=3239228 RepID=UPI003523953F
MKNIFDTKPGARRWWAVAIRCVVMLPLIPFVVMGRIADEFLDSAHRVLPRVRQ